MGTESTEGSDMASKKEPAKDSPQLKKMREAAAKKSNGAAKPAAKAAAKAPSKRKAKKPAKKKAAKKGAKRALHPNVAAKKTAKKTAKKAAAKSAAPKDKASSGQCGPTLKLEAGELNGKERKVLGTLVSASKPMKLSEIAEATFKSLGPIKGNSWTRNSMRRLVRSGLVRKSATGTYSVTAKGKGEKAEIKAEVKAAAPKVKQVLANA